MAFTSQTAIKVVGANGQISLGKQYAGRHVLVEEREAGVWLVRTAVVIPDNERWLLEQRAAEDLKAAMSWATRNEPTDEDLDATLDRLGHDGA
jgi:hypothetical protein